MIFSHWFFLVPFGTAMVVALGAHDLVVHVLVANCRDPVAMVTGLEQPVPMVTRFKHGGFGDRWRDHMRRLIGIVEHQ